MTHQALTGDSGHRDGKAVLHQPTEVVDWRLMPQRGETVQAEGLTKSLKPVFLVIRAQRTAHESIQIVRLEHGRQGLKVRSFFTADASVVPRHPGHSGLSLHNVRVRNLKHGRITLHDEGEHDLHVPTAADRPPPCRGGVFPTGGKNGDPHGDVDTAVTYQSVTEERGFKWGGHAVRTRADDRPSR